MPIGIVYSLFFVLLIGCFNINLYRKVLLCVFHYIILIAVTNTISSVLAGVAIFLFVITNVFSLYVGGSCISFSYSRQRFTVQVYHNRVIGESVCANCTICYGYNHSFHVSCPYYIDYSLLVCFPKPVLFSIHAA